MPDDPKRPKTPPKRPLLMAREEQVHMVITIPPAKPTNTPPRGVLVIESEHDDDERDDHTPVNIPIDKLLARRARQTKELAAVANATVTMVKDDVRILSQRYDLLEKTVDQMDGKLEVLMKHAESGIRINEHRAMTEADDAADERRWKRRKWLKTWAPICAAIAGAITVLATAVAYLIKQM